MFTVFHLLLLFSHPADTRTVPGTVLALEIAENKAERNSCPPGDSTLQSYHRLAHRRKARPTGEESGPGVSQKVTEMGRDPVLLPLAWELPTDCCPSVSIPLLSLLLFY